MKNIVSSIIHYLTLKLKYLKKNIALLGNYIIWSIWKKNLSLPKLNGSPKTIALDWVIHLNNIIKYLD